MISRMIPSRDNVDTAAQAGALTRRVLIGSGLAAVGWTVLGAVPGAATPTQVATTIADLFPGRTLRDGRIRLELPTIAENGFVVPVNFDVESPMTAADYVKTVRIFAERNPVGLIAVFHFTALIPKAAAAIRIRLAETQDVIAVAEMSNGDVYTTRREVKVTVGGCGG